MSRLSDVCDACEGFNVILDVGTDHAYVPIELLRRNPQLKVIASDNKQGPLAHAKRHLEAAGLKDHVELRLGEGLAVLTEPVDVIIMAGMGGSTIAQMVKAKTNLEAKRLICHPTQAPDAVRRLTKTLDYRVVDEIFGVDAGVPYTIIILEPGNAYYSEKELLYGPVLLKKRPEGYLDVLKKEAAFLDGLITQIPEGDKKNVILDKYALLKEVIDERS
jgi:tRNA (adenine22-N1)-methyltransferase